jgi:hypothetical protein
MVTSKAGFCLLRSVSGAKQFSLERVSTSDKVIVAAFEFGGNFLLCDMVGAVIRIGSRRSLNRPTVPTP